MDKYTKKSTNPILQHRSNLILASVVIIIIVGIIIYTIYFSSLRTIRKRGKLIVITTNTSSTYYYGTDGPKGIEYELLTLFANSLGVDVEFKIKHNIREVLIAMEKGEGDIAAAGITKTPARMEKFIFGPPYYEVTQYVVGKRLKNGPQSLEELPNYRPLIVSGTSFEENLYRLKKKYPDLTWDTTSIFSTEQILEMVWLEEVDITICDDKIISLYRRYFPELIPLFPVSEPENVAWILRNKGYDLKRYTKKWFSDLKGSGYLEELVAKYFGYYEVFDYFDIRTFHWRIESRLPLYRKWFEEAGEKYNIPWTLLAALSYQESHWNSKAKSPTGVCGLMMLTQITAHDIGVTNRLDPKQNIFGGAKYLAELLERIPSSVQHNDCYLFALAAYNIGFGHLMDARELAVELNKNPDSWHDLKTVLPLLSQPKYYSKLNYGYARGMEAVRFVDRIVDYRDILEQTLMKPQALDSVVTDLETFEPDSFKTLND
ncbi:MAG: membrane-bound lytic murein transglycosylase MltF [Candidatus Marinimicrobia bacterium]|nr:membrane-bound lytic murein transglycosylase MltF [Candidatus Neomarinimicrobiota bacterium]